MSNEADKITLMLGVPSQPSSILRLRLRAAAVLLALLVPLLAGGWFFAAAAEVKPLEEILKGLPRIYDGRVLDTRLKGKRYEIRVLVKSGTVVELVVDASSGKILKADPDLQKSGG